MKRYIVFKYHFLVALVSVTLLGSISAVAQQTKKKNVVQIEIAATVVDEQGNGIPNALVSANEGSVESLTDNTGSFSVKAKEKSVILVEAKGFESFYWNLSLAPELKKIVLKKAILFAGEKDQRNLPMLVKESTRNLVGAVSQIDGSKLQSYPDALLSNTLQGQALGLIVNMSAGGMANNPAGLFVRGQSRISDHQALTIVDGIERPIDDIFAEEIESIEVLKDATAKILYGPRAANGVILVTTKRGQAQKKVVKVSADYGVGLPTRMPEFLDSYQYAQLHNEARINDGMAPIYSDSDLEGYRNSSGPNDLFYPNVDYYDYFLKENTNYTKVTSEFAGGNKNTRYSVVMGYLNYIGLQSEGPTPTQSRFNLRGNLDIDVSNSIKAFVGMAAAIDHMERSRIDHASTFGALSSHRPNEYPLLIDPAYIEPTKKGVPGLGGSFDHPDNLLGGLAYSGDVKEQYINGQMSTGMDFDLGLITKGLSAKTYVTFDNYFSGYEELQRTPATYDPYLTQNALGVDSVAFVKRQNEEREDKYKLTSNSTSRNIGYTVQVSYDKQLGNGQLSSTLGYFYYLNERKGKTQDIKNDNLYFRSKYVLNNKYMFEANVASMGSNRFNEDNRHFTSLALGAAWVLSDEDFMSGSSAIDFLKLKASWGILGYDVYTDHYLYENRWYNNGNQKFGEKNNSSTARTSLDIIGNPNLDWENSAELNIGVEGLALNQKLSFEFNYFNEKRTDIIQKVSSIYSDIYGGLYPAVNWGEVSNSGFEGALHWKNKSGELTYTFGGNFILCKNKVQQKDEIEYPDAYRNTEGQQSSVIMGYKSLGLFGKDVALEGAPVQTFGAYGIGDIAYADMNDDDVINDLDKIKLGNSFPTATLGIDLDLKYKGWGLYLLGTASLGVENSFDNAFYRNAGIGKYSVLALDRYHPVNNPEGTQPRLTTTSADNNFVTSDFWVRDASFFRLKNVELSYTFNFNNSSAVAKNLKVYTRASNLFVLSKEKDLDPETSNGGVINYPMLTTLVGGISVSF